MCLPLQRNCKMDWSHKLLFSVLLVLSSAIVGARGEAKIIGMVLCDQCMDGQVSFYDYPISGIKVTMSCTDGNGKVIFSREGTTNCLGIYGITISGIPDLRNCYAQVTGSDQRSNSCAAYAGPAMKLNLICSMFGKEIYSVNPLLIEPRQPMSFCPRRSNPVPPHALATLAVPSPPSPVHRWPLLNSLATMPPVPFMEASACTHQNWTAPEYKCYWKAVSPDTKVAAAFGLLAERRYGTDVTLYEGLQGGGDPYKTLLREATTALLNSYNSVQFSYNPLTVVTHMDWALMGSQRRVLLTANSFMTANAGSGADSCKFTPCK